jgi:uncharacterized protein (TIGR02246 family)
VSFWVLVWGLLWCLAPMTALAQTADVVAIERLQETQAEAWNEQNAAAFADLFVEDADLVNMMGRWWRGRDEIRDGMGEAFGSIFRGSELSIADVEVRTLTPLFAVAHVAWTLEGAQTPPGASVPPRRGIQVQVLNKQGRQWRIVSLQNTVCVLC